MGILWQESQNNTDISPHLLQSPVSEVQNERKNKTNPQMNNALFPKELSGEKLTQKATRLLAPHGEEDKYRTHNRTSPPVCFEVINWATAPVSCQGKAICEGDEGGVPLLSNHQANTERETEREREIWVNRESKRENWVKRESVWLAAWVLS